MIQLDTLTIAPQPGTSIKLLHRLLPVGRWTVAHTDRRATSTAASFFDKLLAGMPFPVTALQVDGGSELMAAFETACATKALSSSSCLPSRPSSMAPSNAQMAAGATSSTRSTTYPTGSPSSTR